METLCNLMHVYLVWNDQVSSTQRERPDLEPNEGAAVVFDSCCHLPFRFTSSKSAQNIAI